MLLVLTAVFLMVVLMVLAQWRLLVCLDFIERGRIQAPKPTPFLVTRDTKQFFDFVLLGKYRTSSDAAVLRSFGQLRALIVAQLLLAFALFCYLLATG